MRRRCIATGNATLGFRLRLRAAALIVTAMCHVVERLPAQELIESPVADALADADGPSLVADPFAGHCEDCLVHDEFDEWTPLSAEEFGLEWEAPYWRPFDRLRQLGFRHSSTHGRSVGRGIPLTNSSWMNRPFHIDWFAGPLIGDDLISGQLGQSNVVFSGVRFGWDFDYYWGIDWRFGWADPDLDGTAATERLNGRYFASDIDVLYYPWGDSKVRPYFLWGLGMAEVVSLQTDGTGYDATLLQMPFGVGLVFPQTPWLAWRLEFLDNLAFGNDGVSTMNNLSFTAGMEFRLGARPRSYWPWRSSRNVW